MLCGLEILQDRRGRNYRRIKQHQILPTHALRAIGRYRNCHCGLIDRVRRAQQQTRATRVSLQNDFDSRHAWQTGFMVGTDLKAGFFNRLILPGQ